MAGSAFINSGTAGAVVILCHMRRDVQSAATLNEVKGVIALVGQKMLRRQPLDQLCSLCAIRGGTLCDKDSDRQTMRIHGQMYLGVEPPFVRPIS